MRLSLQNVFYGFTLITLPWVGVGVVNYFFGKDIGSGLQLSWLFLSLAIFSLFLSNNFWDKGAFVFCKKNTVSKPLILLCSGSLLVALISGFGLWSTPSLEPLSSAWWRWGRQIFQLIIMLVFLIWAASWTKGIDRWQKTLDFLFWGCVSQIIYSAFQEYIFYHPQVWFSYFEHFFTSNPSILSGSEKLYINNALQEIPRLRGTMCEPLYLGNYLLMLWPFLLVWRRSVFLRVFLGLAILILLVLTWSRGAWMGALGQLIFFAVLAIKGQTIRTKLFLKNSQNGKRNFTISVLLVFVLLTLGEFLTQGIIHQRLMASFNNQDWSNLTRLYSMKAAWLAFLESPVTGIGWGQFAFHFPLLVEPMGLQSQFSWPVVNNFPLKILCETGLVGALFFMGGVLYLMKKTWQTIDRRQDGTLLYPMVLPAAMSAVGVWVQLMTFSQYNLPHIWIALGLWLAALFANPEGNHSIEKSISK